METEEFKRQIDELRGIISDAIVYFSGWHGLMVEDEESAKALNRYRGFFLPARTALLNETLLQFAKVFDRNPRTCSLRNLLNAAQEERESLTPHATEDDLREIEDKIDASEGLLNRLKSYRDQRLAHHDAIVVSKTSLLYGEVSRLLEDIMSMHNSLTSGHDRSRTLYEVLAREADRHTSQVVDIMRQLTKK